MPCELNPRALYPRLARIVFDLASIRGGRASCEREETVCVSGGRKTQGKTRGTSVSVCCSLFLFFFFLVHKHSSKPGIAVDSIEKHVHQSLMCHPRASWNHTHKTPRSPLRFVKLYKEEGCVAVGKNEEKRVKVSRNEGRWNHKQVHVLCWALRVGELKNKTSAAVSGSLSRTPKRRLNKKTLRAKAAWITREMSQEYTSSSSCVTAISFQWILYVPLIKGHAADVYLCPESNLIDWVGWRHIMTAKACVLVRACRSENESQITTIYWIIHLKKT